MTSTCLFGAVDGGAGLLVRAILLARGTPLPFCAVPPTKGPGEKSHSSRPDRHVTRSTLEDVGALGPTSSLFSRSRVLGHVPLETLGIFAIFALFGSWPTPDLNESHYLLKALHYWRPEFLSGDVFLESAEAHLTFYVVFGWLTWVLPLDAAAWVGRATTWLALAIGWQRLSSAVVPVAGAGLVTAALYATLVERAHMAGEWVIGGFEAKGLAYALVFAGLAALARRRWNAGMAWLGAATAMHVLVGGWALVAAGVCWLWQGSERPQLRSVAPGLAIAGVCGLFGVWPALAVNHGAEPSLVAEAHQIYVFQRVPHHLTPFGFKLEFIARYALQVVAWLALCAWTPRDSAQRIVRGFVVGALSISIVGALISIVLRDQPPLAAPLLRFYWFRLGDVVLPLGVSLVGVALLRDKTWRPTMVVLRYALVALIVLGVGQQMKTLAERRLTPGPSRADGPGKVLDAADWRDASLWIRGHTPESAVVLAPRTAESFKWWARRAEVGSWKDVPQDARGIVEWWTRLREIHGTYADDRTVGWYDSLAEAGESHALRMARKYGASYILTAAEPPLALPCPYRNRSYAVYEVPPLTTRP